MPPSSPPDPSSIRPPHPLAQRLIDRLGSRRDVAVLDFGTGSGRNAVALRAAGFAVTGVSDAAIERGDPLPSGGFAAVVATHNLLHGTTATIAARVATLAEMLVPGGLLYAVFGSVRDARFGHGTRIEAGTFAPVDGDERGVPHAFFTRADLAALLSRRVAVEEFAERPADATAGAWAHPTHPLRGAVHWFVTGERRNEPAGPSAPFAV